ncbi:hypothetical protein D9758_009962 [Tetrapyrgos nigripes]|uniref:Arrestin-like N-terminal domain-containing protein n=1 Tax=Tetrapyrgos nigripes TaxID=182062 RepID=A0A8H5CQU6_9AGAR|nr:hypothetical protein D9758_009962 [Tetrapyrgos nigripes]
MSTTTTSYPYHFLHGSTASLLPGQSTTSLPAYTRRASPSPRRTTRPKTEHIVELSNISGIGGATSKKSKPWAVLKIYSSARSSKSLPVFLEGDKITGSLTLDLGHGGWMSSSTGVGDAITSVKIVVRGEFASGNINTVEGNRTFLEMPTELWTKDAHNPKLSGVQHWPFSISLPGEVFLSRKDEPEVSYPLPHTFLERHTRASIRYDLMVYILRSKLRQNSGLQQTFVYVPAIRPDPPSFLRQLAYQEHSPLANPSIDPEGWLTLPPVDALGTVFDTRSVRITCTLSLAKPLCYTRNSFIPLSLLLESDDSLALDLLTANPESSINVRLRRQTHLFSSETVLFNNYRNPLWTLHNGKVDGTHDLGDATWWLSSDDHDESTEHRKRIRLDGEIPLTKDLKPSTLIPYFALEYSIVLLPFTATGFVPSPCPSPSSSATFSPAEDSPTPPHTKVKKKSSRASTSPAPSTNTNLPGRSASYSASSTSNYVHSQSLAVPIPTRSASFTPRPSTSPSASSSSFSSNPNARLSPNHTGSHSHGGSSGSGGGDVKPLLSQTVSIATVFAKGPRPVSGKPGPVLGSTAQHSSRGDVHGLDTGDDSLPPEYEDHVSP